MTAKVALQKKVIDLIADDMTDLLEVKLPEHKTKGKSKEEVEFDTKDAVVKELEMSLPQQLHQRYSIQVRQSSHPHQYVPRNKQLPSGSYTWIPQVS